MRIPRSVVVMTVVTAVPFGLGIRDTLAKKGGSGDDVLGAGLFSGESSARERSRELEEYEAEMRREQEQREARAQARLGQLDQLFGAKPATMGSLLDGIQLGASAGTFQPETVRQRIEKATRDGFLHVFFDADAKSLTAVNVAVSGDYVACQKLDEKLTAAWGQSTNGAWLDASMHQRATLERKTCTLRFDTYLEPTDWVAQLPFAAVGTSADKLADQVGGSAEVDDDHIAWSVPGLRYGKSATKVEATVEKGKVVGVKAWVDTDYDSVIAVRDAISAKLKVSAKGGLDVDARVYHWKSPTPVVLDEDGIGSGFSVVIGKTPWER